MSSKEADKMLKIDSKFDTLTYDDLPKDGQKKDDDSPVQLKVFKYVCIFTYIYKDDDSPVQLNVFFVYYFYHSLYVRVYLF
jgi:hypothetical protein